MSAFHLKNQLLVATPRLNDDPTFGHTVIYVCEHNETGSMGVIINQPADPSFNELVQDLGLESHRTDLPECPLFIGGPVEQGKGFVLHFSSNEENLAQKDKSQFIHNLENASIQGMLGAMIAEHTSDEEQLMFFIGHTAWSAGQLEAEILENDWLVVPSEGSLFLEVPHENRRSAAARSIGVDFSCYAHEIGHA